MWAVAVFLWIKIELWGMNGVIMSKIIRSGILRNRKIIIGIGRKLQDRNKSAFVSLFSYKYSQKC